MTRRDIWMCIPILVALAGCGRTQSPAETTAGLPNPAAGAGHATGCEQVPTTELQRLLKDAPTKGEAGGLAGGRFSWAAVVNRDGRLCAVAVSSDDPSATWPGSLGIAKAKAYTANAFSTRYISAFDGATLHAEPARPLTMGYCRRQSSEPRMSGHAPQPRRPRQGLRWHDRVWRRAAFVQGASQSWRSWRQRRHGLHGS